MANDISFGSNPSLTATTYTQTDMGDVAVQTKVIDDLWSQDSIVPLSGPNGINGQYTKLPNSPTIPKPNQQLIEETPFLNEQRPVEAWSSEKFPSTADKYPSDDVANSTYDDIFESLIKGLPDADKLREAHYLAKPGTPPTTKEEIKAFELLKAQFPTLGAEFSPSPNKANFEEKANLSYDDEFTAQLETQDPPLSEAAKAKLKSLHYRPDIKFKGSDDPQLQKQFQSIEGKAKAATTEKFGLPPDGLKPSTNSYDSMLNGFYQESLANGVEEFLKGAGSKMSPEDQKMLEKFVNDPTLSVSQAVADAAAIIKAQAIAQVVSLMNLEGIGFQPAALGTFMPLNPMLKGIASQMSEIHKQGMKVVESMGGAGEAGGANGPLKTILQDVLRRISLALSKFKEAMYASQGVTSEQAQANSKAKLDIALNEIKANVKQAKEAAGKADKLASMGVFGKIFKFIIMLILLIVSALTFNPVGMMVAVMGMMDVVAPEMQVFKKVMEGIGQMVKVLMPYLPPEKLTAFQDIAKFMFILASGPIAIMVALPDLLTASSIIKHIAMATGKSAEEAESIEQMAIMIMGLTITIIVTIATIILTLGAAAPGMISGLVAKASQTAAEVIKEVGRSIAKLMENIPNWANKAMTGAMIANDVAGFVQGGLQVGQAIVKNDMIRLLEKMKVRKIESDAQIEMLLKLVKKLLAILNGDAAAITFISNIQSHVLSSASQAASKITGVSSA
jgi:hypothetical protein